ncbi:MAG: class I SAM-dependent methyltransferase [Deltaproteobacteria bacterium]|nr:class I SAM-dependent methyltransferase [Candidatus Zymogenaceae bacterium]
MKKDHKTAVTKDFYEGEYVGDFERQPVDRLRRLLPLLGLGKDDKVVDFACGNGMLADVIHDRVGDYTGVDFSRAFIAAAGRRAELLGITNVRFVCDDIVRFCARHRDTFEKAFTMDFSEHISDDDFMSIYSSIFGSLKEGGTLYIHTPNGDYFIETLKRIGILRQFPEHIAVRNAPRYRELLEKVGFRDITIRHIAHYNVLKYLHFLSYLPFVGKFGKARLFMECRKRAHRDL